MGTALTGNTVSSTYNALLKTTANTAADGTLRQVSDGLGNDIPMKVSTAYVSVGGTNTNDNADAGYIGEYSSSSIAAAGALSIVTDTAKNVTSLSLTAGDWDVEGVVYFLPDGSTTWDLFLASISTTSATHGSRDSGYQSILKASGGFGIGISSSLVTPRRRVSIGSTTTVYLVGSASFSAGSPSIYGTITARRVR